MSFFRSLVLAALLGAADAYAAGRVASAAPMAIRRAASSPAMVLDMPDLPAVTSLLAEIVDENGERVYGAVEAPGWVVPVGGLLAILTALLPVLLAPGDEAFRRQRASPREELLNPDAPPVPSPRSTLAQRPPAPVHHVRPVCCTRVAEGDEQKVAGKKGAQLFGRGRRD